MVFGTQGVPPKTLTKIASKKCTTKDLGVRFCAFVNAPPSFPFSTFRPEFDTIRKIRFFQFPIYIFHRTKLARWSVVGISGVLNNFPSCQQRSIATLASESVAPRFGMGPTAFSFAAIVMSTCIVAATSSGTPPGLYTRRIFTGRTRRVRAFAQPYTAKTP